MIKNDIIVLYGAGRVLRKNIDIFKKNSVIAIFDKNKTCETLAGIPVLLPEELNKIKFDYIVITTNKYFEEIANELIFQYGVKFNRFLSFKYYFSILKDSGGSIPSTSPARLTWDLYNLIERQSLPVINIHRALFLTGKSPTIVDSNCLNHNDLPDRMINIGGSLYISEHFYRSHTKIYVVKHKEINCVCGRSYQTIGVGINKDLFNCDLRDDVGENIASYNNLINECTALYWLWKNADTDFIGLNHYRRYFESPINKGWPIQDWEIEEILKGTDIIVTKPVFFSDNMIQQLKVTVCAEALEQSLFVMQSIFDRKSNKELQAFNLLLSEMCGFYSCQMFVMSKERLNEYCSWLFPIIFEMIERVEIKEDWDQYSKRIIGFWAERLLTVWLLYTNYSIVMLPIIQTDFSKPYGMDNNEQI